MPQDTRIALANEPFRYIMGGTDIYPVAYCEPNEYDITRWPCNKKSNPRRPVRRQSRGVPHDTWPREIFRVR